MKLCSICSRCFDNAVPTCPSDGTDLEIVLAGPAVIDEKYRIIRCLGRGGMGAVYEAEHLALGKKFALKLILGGGAAHAWYRTGFENEARVLGTVRHRNIVEITDYGIDEREGGVPYLVMEYLDGETLAHQLDGRRALPLADAVLLLRAVADAIDAAHHHGVVHGDLKPSNLIAARQQDGSVILKVVDFGLARFPTSGDGSSEPIRAEAATVTMGFHGTPAYMAPELFDGTAATNSSDIFAFGVIAYEAVTGFLPFGREGCGRAVNYRRPQAPSHRAALPPELDGPLLSLLAPDATQRPPNATEAVRAIESACVAARRRAWRRAGLWRHAVFSAVAAAAALFVAGQVDQLPLVKGLEARTVDARFRVAPARSADPQFIVVDIDDSSTLRDTRPFSDWSDTVTAAIRRMFDSGARWVAVDIPIPDSWSRSNDFAELVLRHADQLTLGIYTGNLSFEKVGAFGANCLTPDIEESLGYRFAKLFGFLDIEPDADGVVRQARTSIGPGQITLVGRAIDNLRATPALFWIDYSVRPQTIPRLPFMNVMNADPAWFRNRTVFLGSTSETTYPGEWFGRSIGSTSWRIPDASRIPSVVLQAQIANTVGTGTPNANAALHLSLLIGCVPAFILAAFGLRYPDQPRTSILLLLSATALYVVFAFLMGMQFRWVLPIVAPLLEIILAFEGGVMLRLLLPNYPERIRQPTAS